MRFASTFIAGVLGAAFLIDARAAGDPGSAYPYPPAPDPNAVMTNSAVGENDALPTVTVNGIDTMHGNPQVAFKVTDGSGTRAYVLGRGEEREEIRIEAIDQKNETVTINNHGRVQKIGLERTAVPSGPPPVPETPIATPNVEPATVSGPIRKSQPDVGPGVSVVVIGHRDPPPQVNGLAPMDTAPVGGVGGGGVFMTNVAFPTNRPVVPNTNSSVRVPLPGQLNMAGRSPTVVPQSPVRASAPPVPGSSQTSGQQPAAPSPPPQPAPPPMPPTR